MTDPPPRDAGGRVPRLHVVTDDRILARAGWTTTAVAVLEAGGEAIALHLRGPGSGGATLFAHASALRPEAERTGSALVVNDRVDVALASGIRRVHLGRRSLSVRATRSVLADAIVGVSTHGPAEVDEAVRAGADYLFFGPAFRTPSHEGVPGTGVSGLCEAVGRARGLPLLGIGGIGVEQTAAVMGTEAHGVAVVRGVWDDEDPPAAVASYARVIREAIE